MAMHLVPVFIILTVWFVLLVWLYVYTRRHLAGQKKKKAKLNVDKWSYEEMATIYDGCNAFTATHVYFFRIVYGQHNKRFFLPIATIRVLLINTFDKQVGKIEIKPDVLLQNHRKYLGKAFKTRATSLKKQLNVLIKRRSEYANVKYIKLEHSIYGGTLFVYGIYMINLMDNRVYGTKVDAPIHHLEEGLRSSTQRFEVSYYGTYLHYIGPSYNLNVLEFFLIAQIGLSLLFVWCSASVSCCQGILLQCRDYSSLTYALETCIFASVFALLASLAWLALHRFLCKGLNARLKAASCMVWLAVKYAPYTVWFFCLLFDLITITIMLSESEYASPDIRNAQRIYWMVSVLTSLVIYTLTMTMLLQILMINHQFDVQELPKIDLESSRLGTPPASSTVLKRLNSNISNKNIKVSERFRLALEEEKTIAIAKQSCNQLKTISDVVNAFKSEPTPPPPPSRSNKMK